MGTGIEDRIQCQMYLVHGKIRIMEKSEKMEVEFSINVGFFQIEYYQISPQMTHLKGKCQILQNKFCVNHKTSLLQQF
jgi:hypothetical protein